MFVCEYTHPVDGETRRSPVGSYAECRAYAARVFKQAVAKKLTVKSVRVVRVTEVKKAAEPAAPAPAPEEPA